VLADVVEAGGEVERDRAAEQLVAHQGVIVHADSSHMLP
jgi:hypothetical protein